MDERPEFFVPLGRQVRMMRLMHHAVEAEAHEAEGSNDSAIYFIQKATLPKQTMRCFVQADQHPVHEMARDEDQRHRQPIKAVIDGEAQRSLRDEENHYKQLEGRLAHPVRLMRFNRIFCG